MNLGVGVEIGQGTLYLWSRHFETSLLLNWCKDEYLWYRHQESRERERRKFCKHLPLTHTTQLNNYHFPVALVNTSIAYGLIKFIKNVNNAPTSFHFQYLNSSFFAKKRGALLVYKTKVCSLIDSTTTYCRTFRDLHISKLLKPIVNFIQNIPRCCKRKYENHGRN